jgi:hypothetical protein
VTDAVGQLAASCDEVRPLLVFRLKFAQPCRHSSEEVGLVAMRAAKLSAVARQTSEARCVQINPGVNYFAGHRAHKTQRGHHHSLAIIRHRQRGRYQSDVREDKQSVGQIFPRDVASGRNAAIISGDLIFALSFGNPVPLGSFYCCLRSRTTTDCFIMPIRNFGLIGTLPKHQFLGPGPTGARRSYFGHQRILTARCDEKIAQSTKQMAQGRVPHESECRAKNLAAARPIEGRSSRGTLVAAFAASRTPPAFTQ